MPDEFISIDQVDNLDNESKYLVHKAKEALDHAYAPYSKFQVAAALLLDDGTVITGTNQENSSSPAGMCAERVAVYAAAAQRPGKRMTRIAVVARRKGGKDLVPATPCGLCRQVLLEFERRQKKPIACVMLAGEHQWLVSPSTSLLMPFAFTTDMPTSGKKE